MRFHNQCIVITGSGAGIGRSCAAAFAAAGGRVVVADVDGNAAEATVAAITAAGGTAAAFVADVSNEANMEALAGFAQQRFGAVHVLVNNAAVQVNKTIEATDYAEWNRQMAVNMGGMFLGAKYFLPLLRHTRGNIINMSSVNGFFTEAACAGYCATKAAIIGFTKALAIDCGADGIRVNCVCPGYIDAGLAEGYFNSQPDPAKARQDAGKLHALGRIGQPAEVAQTVLFLASADASFITGAALVVDGGLSSGLPPQ